MIEFLESLLGANILAYLVSTALPLVFVLVYVLVTLYTEMKTAAHIQNRLAYMRVGWHGVLQPFADILKLLQKEDIIPSKADKALFIIAPYVVFIGAFAPFAAIPFSPAYIASNINLGAFFVIAVGSISVIAVLMAGWASNNKFSLLGAMRSAAQIVSYEVPTALAVLVVLMLAGSLNLMEISAKQDGGIWNWFLFGGSVVAGWKKIALIPFMVITFVCLLLSCMAEVNRTPFDLTEAESELVQGFNTELSGMKFAMFYLAEYSNMFLISALISVFFLGGWSSPIPGVMSGPWWGFFWIVAKGSIFVFLQIWLRWTLPRVRVDQLMYIAWKVLIPFLFVCIFAVGFILVV